MNTAITLGSKTSTGGVVLTASSGSFINGVGIACIGDSATCCCGSKGCSGVGRIVATSARAVELNGVQLARKGDFVDSGCGSCFLLAGENQITLASENSTVFLGNGVYMGGSVSIGGGSPISSVTRGKYQVGAEGGSGGGNSQLTMGGGTDAKYRSLDSELMETINEFSPTSKQIIKNMVEDGVYLWVETKGVGHTLISIFKNGKPTIYSYGRYSDKENDGVLLVYKNKDALSYINRELFKMNASVYLIPDADENSINEFFENAWINGGTVNYPRASNEESAQRIRKYGRVIDNYDLTSSNCTTHAMDALYVRGSELFKQKDKFIVPNSLEEYLEWNYPQFNRTLRFELFFSDIYDKNSREYKEGIRDSIYSSTIESVSFVTWLFDL
ncbi:PAAR domain-containing protein [Photobacterium damselae]|uniref:PAAR domain-containing protein n=1 Tax=Photobacterium damselae TaxID=38293 RepID=UPI004068FA89